MSVRQSRKSLVATGLLVTGFTLISGMMAWALDVSDIRPEWTEEGKEAGFAAGAVAY